MPILMCQYYVSDSAARNRELELCYRENLKNSAISEFVWFVEESLRDRLPSWLQGRIVPLPGRLKYADAFRASQSGQLHILANSDIILSEQAVRLIDAHLQPDEAYCLSRWDCDPKDELNLDKACLWQYYGRSQDVWCWRGALECRADFALGVPGCDNRIAHELSAVRRVSNPSLSIKTLHVHSSSVRSYTRATVIPPPYRDVRATALPAL